MISDNDPPRSSSFDAFSLYRLKRNVQKVNVIVSQQTNNNDTQHEINIKVTHYVYHSQNRRDLL